MTLHFLYCLVPLFVIMNAVSLRHIDDRPKQVQLESSDNELTQLEQFAGINDHELPRPSSKISSERVAAAFSPDLWQEFEDSLLELDQQTNGDAIDVNDEFNNEQHVKTPIRTKNKSGRSKQQGTVTFDELVALFGDDTPKDVSSSQPAADDEDDFIVKYFAARQLGSGDDQSGIIEHLNDQQLDWALEKLFGGQEKRAANNARRHRKPKQPKPPPPSTPVKRILEGSDHLGDDEIFQALKKMFKPVQEIPGKRSMRKHKSPRHPKNPPASPAKRILEF